MYKSWFLSLQLNIIWLICSKLQTWYSLRVCLSFFQTQLDCRPGEIGGKMPMLTATASCLHWETSPDPAKALQTPATKNQNQIHYIYTTIQQGKETIWTILWIYFCSKPGFSDLVWNTVFLICQTFFIFSRVLRCMF